jgi:MmeI, target recognition domain
LAFVEKGTVVQDTLTLLLLCKWSDFSVLQSRVHEAWIGMVGTTKGDAMYYTTTCFDTFPRPVADDLGALEKAGSAYYQLRAALMVRNDEGLTKTYNRFHDPEEDDQEILKLRELHTAIDHAVLAAYGWTDIDTDCKFLLDYEIDAEEWGDRKKPWRYRWSDEVQAEVLARLLELNAERARSEVRSGAAEENKRGRKRGVKATLSAPGQEGLL